MLVTFIGAPLSGKTTVAASAFAHYKTDGIPCDFVAEQARLYIAEKRLKLRARPPSPIALDNDDQYAIMRRQLGVELALKFSSKESIGISDTFSLCSLLYMTPEFRSEPKIAELVARAIAMPDLLFLADPVCSDDVYDPLRIHNAEERQRLHGQIEEVLSTFAPNLKPVILRGNANERLADALHNINAVYEHELCASE